jgi:hypothetical protein
VFTHPPAPGGAEADRTFPGRNPDVDKLQRSTLDGLTQAGLYKDDGQVVGYRRMFEFYAGDPDPDALTSPGAVIRAWVLPREPLDVMHGPRALSDLRVAQSGMLDDPDVTEDLLLVGVALAHHIFTAPPPWRLEDAVVGVYNCGRPVAVHRARTELAMDVPRLRRTGSPWAGRSPGTCRSSTGPRVGGARRRRSGRRPSNPPGARLIIDPHAEVVTEARAAAAAPHPLKPGAAQDGTQRVPSCTLEDVSGQQQNVTRQGAPWWLNAVLAAADQAEAGADDLTPEERAQLADAARRIYAAALPPGTTDPDDVRRQVEAIAAAIFAGGNIAAPSPSGEAAGHRRDRRRDRHRARRPTIPPQARSQ